MTIVHKYPFFPDPLQENYYMHIMNAFKYRIMWELRHLEQRIDEEGGDIKYYRDKDGEFYIETNGFSIELAEDIRKVLRSIDYSAW